MRAYDIVEPATIRLKKGTRILIRRNRALVSLPTADLAPIRALLVPAEHPSAPKQQPSNSEEARPHP